jgi:hypothetical protein
MRDQKQQEQSSLKVVSSLRRVLAKCPKGSIPFEHQNTFQNLLLWWSWTQAMELCFHSMILTQILSTYAVR